MSKKDDPSKGRGLLLARMRRTLNIKQVMEHPVPILCLDVAVKKTGHMMMYNDFSIEENELPQLVPLYDDFAAQWNFSQTLDCTQLDMLRNALWPDVQLRLDYFKNELRIIIQKYEAKLSQKGLRTNLGLKFLAVESVFIHRLHMSSALPLARFQNAAIQVAQEFNYLPYEYANTEVKGLLEVKGQKEYVVPMVNEMYNIQIPTKANTPNKTLAYYESFTHVGDAIGLGYLHSFCLRELANESKPVVQQGSKQSL